jgi:poly(hydroxyalkanoate) depolymerase family esterase
MFNNALMSKLQDATRQLMADGPLAATAAIQQALGGLPGAAPGQPAMRDVNPAPTPPARRTGQGASARATETIDTIEIADPADAASATGQGASPSGQGHPGHGRKHTGPRAAHAGGTHPGTKAGQTAPGTAAPGTQAFVDGLLAKLGALQPGGAMPMPDLSNLQQMDLPGMRKARAPRPLPPGAQFVDGVYSGATGTRHYKLYIPAGYHGQPLPLVVMLHGCTQDPDDFAAGTRMNELAEEQGCLVVYPAQSQQANQQRCWNWFNALDQQRGQGEPAIIAGIAQQVAAQYAVRPGQVYVAGMSAGGAMAVIAGTLYPDVFAAVGVHSGLPYASAKDLPSALQAMKQGAAAKNAAGNAASRPIIVFHGDRDHTVHPRNGEQVIAQQLHRHRDAQAQRDGGSVPDGHRYTRTTHRHADGTPLGEHWVVHGAGHAWSGGSADGSYTDTRGPDASREMLRFFRTVGA